MLKEIRVSMRAIIAVGLGLTVAFLAGCGKEDRPDQADAAKRPPELANRDWPNILLITLDSVRYDHLHCLGYERPTTPCIDQLASEGAIFDACISASSWTLPTHAALLTSVASSINGVTDVDKRLSDKGITMPEMFKNTGYHTAAFVSNPLLAATFGLNDGFDEYIECLDPPANDETAKAAGATSPAVLQAVEQWMSKTPARPFLLLVNFSDAMFDYTPPPPFDKQFDPDYSDWVTGRNVLNDQRIGPDINKRDLEHLIALYDGEIAWVDQHVGRLIDRFREAGLLDSTVVVVLSSHGTGFFEHKMKGQRNNLFDELIRVPLVIRYPQRVPPGQRFKEQCRTIDVFPTIADLIGHPMPAAMGRTLAPLFIGQSIDTRGTKETAFSELCLYGQNIQAIRQPERKTIWFVEADRGQVYDLVADPGELAAVGDPDTPTVKGAKADTTWTRKIFFKEFVGSYPAAENLPELPQNVLDKLNALGYLDGQVPMLDVQP